MKSRANEARVSEELSLSALRLLARTGNSATDGTAESRLKLRTAIMSDCKKWMAREWDYFSGNRIDDALCACRVCENRSARFLCRARGRGAETAASRSRNSGARARGPVSATPKRRPMRLGTKRTRRAGELNELTAGEIEAELTDRSSFSARANKRTSVRPDAACIGKMTFAY